MRSCFIDHNQEANVDLLEKHQVDTVLIPGEESPEANPYATLELQAAGFKVEVMFAWNWHGFGFRPPEEFARYCHERLKKVGHPSVNPSVLLDIEKGAGVTDFTYVDWVVRCLTEWRKLRPTRPTNLTLEGYQGGLFKPRPDAVAKLLGMVGGFIPQAYGNIGGNPEYPFAADTVKDDLEWGGFPRHRIKCFYVANPVPYNMDGYLWRQGTLPA